MQDRERQGAIDEIDANLNDSRITLVRVRVDERRARALAATARAKGTPPATRRRAAALAAGYQAMATVIRERIEPDVLANGLTQAAFAKARALLIETAEARRDLDPKPELALNARLNQRADDLRELGVAALIVALLLTCAEVLASGWYRLFLAVGVGRARGQRDPHAHGRVGHVSDDGPDAGASRGTKQAVAILSWSRP